MIDSEEISETEDQLIQTAQVAVSSCNWVVGECAAKWTKKYAKGRTDADFATEIGLTPDQVFQRRRVWETFGDVYKEYNSLKWSHFYVALNWDDAPECLQWAEDNEATVAEMRAWRRAVQGEDLTEAAIDQEYSEWGGDPHVVHVPFENTLVKDPADMPVPSGEGSRLRSGGQAAETVAAHARESQSGEDYAPFNQGATAVPKSESGGATATQTSPREQAEQLVKKLTVALERFEKEVTPTIAREMPKLDEKMRSRLLKALHEVNGRISRIY
ncbi:MAG: hypothetical protein HUJ26_05180 [Planctomycetaceae bacterium]|nr:hypothetical protein [Planctomycetaceae bacterium]